MLSDSELLTLLKSDSNKGLTKLMKLYTGYVYTIAAGKLSGSCKTEDIEECVSDVFYDFFRNRNTVDLSKGSVKVYLAVLTKRRAVDTYRKQYRENQHISIEEEETDFPSHEVDPACSIEQKETADRLVSEIKALGEPDSQILILKYYYQQSSKQIAEKLSLKVNTVDKKVSRALEKLKQRLGGVI